jgi:hypothetical protein
MTNRLLWSKVLLVQYLLQCWRNICTGSSAGVAPLPAQCLHLGWASFCLRKRRHSDEARIERSGGILNLWSILQGDFSLRSK